MAIRSLLDTHILIRRLAEPHKLSKEQSRLIDEAERNGDQSAVSAFSLVELAWLHIGGRLEDNSLRFLLDQLSANPAFTVLPITTEVAREVSAMGGTLRDPADQTIVATARVHRLKLLTADQRIIESQLAFVID